MSKSWRERAVEAEERGAFTAEDLVEFHYPDRCVVGEIVSRYRDRGDIVAWVTLYDQIGNCRSPLQEKISGALTRNEPAILHRCIDEAEDRALEIKRGQA